MGYQGSLVVPVSQVPSVPDFPIELALDIELGEPENPISWGYQPLVDVSVGSVTGQLLGGHFAIEKETRGIGAAYFICTSECCAKTERILEPQGTVFSGPGFERHGGCESRKKWRESVKIAAHVDAAKPSLEYWLAEQSRRQFGGRVVDTRVAIFFPKQRRYYCGCITKFRKADGCHFIEYDDGDKQWLHLALELHRFLGPNRPISLPSTTSPSQQGVAPSPDPRPSPVSVIRKLLQITRASQIPGTNPHTPAGLAGAGLGPQRSKKRPLDHPKASPSKAKPNLEHRQDLPEEARAKKKRRRGTSAYSEASSDEDFKLPKARSGSGSAPGTRAADPRDFRKQKRGLDAGTGKHGAVRRDVGQGSSEDGDDDGDAPLLNRRGGLEAASRNPQAGNAGGEETPRGGKALKLEKKLRRLARVEQLAQMKLPPEVRRLLPHSESLQQMPEVLAGIRAGVCGGSSALGSGSEAAPAPRGGDAGGRVEALGRQETEASEWEYEPVRSTKRFRRRKSKSIEAAARNEMAPSTPDGGGASSAGALVAEHNLNPSNDRDWPQPLSKPSHKPVSPAGQARSGAQNDSPGHPAAAAPHDDSRQRPSPQDDQEPGRTADEGLGLERKKKRRGRPPKRQLRRDADEDDEQALAKLNGRPDVPHNSSPKARKRADPASQWLAAKLKEMRWTVPQDSDSAADDKEVTASAGEAAEQLAEGNEQAGGSGKQQAPPESCALGLDLDLGSDGEASSDKNGDEEADDASALPDGQLNIAPATRVSESKNKRSGAGLAPSQQLQRTSFEECTDSSDGDEPSLQNDSDPHGELLECEWSSAAEAARLERQDRRGGGHRGFDVELEPGFARRYPHLDKKHVEAAAKDFLGLAPKQRRRRMRQRAGARVICDLGHPAVKLGQQQGRQVERMLVSKGVEAGQLIGEYTGVVRLGAEVDDEVSRHPEGIGGFLHDKVKAIHSTDSATWPASLVVDATRRGNMLRFMNHDAAGGANCEMLEVEDKRSGRVHMLAFALADVPAGRELLLDYGADYWRHMREEHNRARALLKRDEVIASQTEQLGLQEQKIAALQRQLAELQATSEQQELVPRVRQEGAELNQQPGQPSATSEERGQVSNEQALETASLNLERDELAARAEQLQLALRDRDAELSEREEAHRAALSSRDAKLAKLRAELDRVNRLSSEAAKMLLQIRLKP